MINKDMLINFHEMRMKDMIPIMGRNDDSIFLLKESEQVINKLSEEPEIEMYVGDMYLKILNENILFIYVYFLIDKKLSYKTFFLPSEMDSKILLDIFLESSEYYIITQVNKHNIKFIHSKKESNIHIPDYSITKTFRDCSFGNKEKILKWYNAISPEEFLKLIKRMEKNLIPNQLDLSRRTL